jgi:hypothetical protein
VYNTRLVSTLPQSGGLDPNYVTGFTDGEGCFYIGISPDKRFSSGYRVKLSFQIGLHIKDSGLLKLISSYFGIGIISKLSSDSVLYRVSTIEGLRIIISHFDKYPLKSYKYKDYLLFRKAFLLVQKGEHLSLSGLKKIVAIKASINLKISASLAIAFPNIVPVPITTIEDSARKILNYNWVAGFTDAEGCFFVAHKKSPGSKLGETV